ncbi:DNA polymerase [Rhizobium sp. 768_B6_N1_8]|uniref:DNA polymerase n=1 Tax=unclassified Rhizobium TaxID=2613769 RepID=UPI003F228B40
MHKYSFANTFTFKIEPDEQGGATKTVSINRHNIAVPPDPGRGKKKKQEPKAHLLIGFDTEYQAVDDRENQSTIEPGAKNTLLSYQFSIKLLEQGKSEGHPETDGIIIPDENERLTMEQFIGFAIGSLIEKYPDVILPVRVYLLGHFLRADLPAFSDFKEKAQAMMDNVRSTFVTIDSAIPVVFAADDNQIAEFKVSIRDTVLLAPGNVKTLAAIGEIVGFPKIELGSTPEEDKAIKQNMSKFRAEHWPEFREYGIRDAQVCARYAERVIAQSESLFGQFKMPATLTSFGTKLLLQGWKENEKDPLAILGREKAEERKFNKKLGYYKKEDATPFLEDVHYEEAFITETYHGGRNEQFIYGAADESTWRDHDLSSAYMTAMSLIGLPDWLSVRRIEKFDDIGLDDLAYFSVDFEFPPEVRFPTLPVRTSNGIVFPRKGNSKCAAPELFLAKQLGAKLRLRRGVIVPTDKEIRVFRDFIQTSVRNRNQHAKRTFDNLFWKEIGNSTYGKTAQGLRKKRVYDLQEDDMRNLPESKITQPYFASFITSYTRAVLGEMLNSFSARTQVFSVTTDGFLSNADDEEIDSATDGPLFSSFAEAQKQLDEKGQPLEVKHVVRRPIGWRTRGSATLVAGDDENGIVLQKGGIKTKSFNDPIEENKETVGLFLNRTPDKKIEYKSGVGIKDMLRNDTDYVYRSVSKRLSMEFDWKRKPINEKDVQFDFDGITHVHLSFDTVPIETVADFDRVRETWEKYNKKARHNLKRLNDFRNFEVYQLTDAMPDRDAALYLRQHEGDIKRLRRDLARAFKHFQAGFDVILDKHRVTHSEFRNALEHCGISCRISDLDNAKRQEFKPHQTPDTPRVREALQMLKQHYYPQLEIELLLPEETTDKTQKSSLSVAA